MTAALRLLGAQGEAALEAFDTVLAGEVTPTWRALALLGRGLCEELRGSAGPAAADVRAALELWMAADPGAGAVALAALGRALSRGGDLGAGAALLAAARRLGVGQPTNLSAVLVELGSAAAERGDAEAAAADWREAMGGDDPRSWAAATANLGRLAAASGDASAADALFEKALLVGEGPHLRVVADGLVHLAAQAAADGRWDDADARLCQALPLRQADADNRGMAEVLHDLGVAHWRRGQLLLAARCFEDCRGSAEEVGDEGLRCVALRALAGVALEEGRVVVALAYGHEAGLAAPAPDDRRAAALLLQQVGDQARRRGDASLSSEAFRAAAQILSDPAAAGEV
jgi:tetratricopeptide (TPR) repeat protein